MTESPAKPKIETAAKWRWTWLIPIAAIIFVAFLYNHHISKRGPTITITMTHGHGIKAGHTLRCHGIEVGKIERVTLTEDLKEVAVTVRLDPASAGIAREGSRFWVVRPRVSLTGFAGLETIAGPQYIDVFPGDGPPAKTFRALAEPPVVDNIDPDGLTFTLLTGRRGSLRPGAPITYRQVHVGDVLDVKLSDDASQVRVECYIDPTHTYLIRDNTVYWNVSGSAMHFGLTGLRWEFESMQALLDGGIALATPEPPGKPIRSGQIFILNNEPESKWLKWAPKLRIP